MENFKVFSRLKVCGLIFPGNIILPPRKSDGGKYKSSVRIRVKIGARVTNPGPVVILRTTQRITIETCFRCVSTYRKDILYESDRFWPTQNSVALEAILFSINKT